MADAISIDRLRLRLLAGSAADPRGVAEELAQALAAGAPDLGPVAAVPLLRVRLSHEARARPRLGHGIAAAVLRNLRGGGAA